MRRFLRRGGYCLYHEIVTAPEPGHPMVRVAAGMDALVANSRAVARGMREAIPGVPVCTIPFMTASSPVDAPEPRPPIASRELRVVYLGRLVRHKRVDRLVRDWPRISTCIGPARLDIYGADFEGERMLAALRGFVREHRLEQQVCLHGAYDAHRDVARILQAADVVLLPSIFEGLPLTLIEAMQRGVPIVASAAGGTPELAENNPDVQVTGLGWDTFVAGLAAMAAALRRGEIDPMRLHRWTEARYGFETVADQWVQALLNPGEFWSQISLHPAS
jgi:glycosyltransferase involved in cell wall biosynthesis